VAPCISFFDWLLINLGAWWTFVTYITSRSLYPWKEPRYPLKNRVAALNSVDCGMITEW